MKMIDISGKSNAYQQAFIKYDARHFAGRINLPASGLKKCVTGKVCGNTCIPKNNICRLEQTVPETNKDLITLGADYLKEQVEDNAHALVSLFQNTLNESGLRIVYPRLVNDLEKFTASKNKNLEQEYQEMLAGIVLTARIQIDRGDAVESGKASPRTRLRYVNKLINDPLRAEEFKTTLTKLKTYSSNTPPYPEELAAIRYYTTTVGYKEVNFTARGQVVQLKDWLGVQKWRPGDNRSIDQIKKDARLDTRMINSGLASLPNYEGKAYRGLNLSDDLIAKLEPGKKWKEKGFTSTTKDFFTRYPGNVAMVIESKSGKDITQYEKYQNNEILFKSGTSFTVKSKRKVKKFGQDFYLVNMIEN